MPIQIYGLDFNDTPRAERPIAVASCLLSGDVLAVNCLASLASLETFENFLSSAGPWVAAIDFPFGIPRRVVENAGWPGTWDAFVRASESFGAAHFEDLLSAHADGAHSGRDVALREADRHARAAERVHRAHESPGRTFLQGAPRLLRSPVSILPCRPNSDNRIVLEGDPGLVARRLIGDRNYREVAGGGESLVLEHAREALVTSLLQGAMERDYAITVEIEHAISRELTGDARGEFLDAVLCAVQAAWAWTRRDQGWGIPARADALEGWIIDPGCLPPDRRPSVHCVVG